MKKTLVAVAMLSCLTLAGCEKETDRLSDYYVLNQCEESCYICYVDGVRTTFPSNETDLDQLMTMLMKLAMEGKTVSICDSHLYTSVNTSKERVIYTTTDLNDAKEWGKQMIKQGYNVTIEFDESTGIYTCTAIR